MRRQRINNRPWALHACNPLCLFKCIQQCVHFMTFFFNGLISAKQLRVHSPLKNMHVLTSFFHFLMPCPNFFLHFVITLAIFFSTS